MLARRLLSFVASLLVCLAATATTVEQRSPFRQGHWWDPTRSGHGFEVLNSGDNVFVVWYTYDAAERPTWYTAQGTVQTMGGSWPVQKHRWGGSAIAESTTVGAMRLALNHFESMTAVWELNGAFGTWKIEPFVQSGIINEVDLSGHWFDPANSGWGMTLVDQGDVFGAVIYAYDAAGAPTWVAGFDRGKGTHVDLYSTRGACPSCTQRAIDSQPAGSMDLTYRGDTEVTLRSALTVALAPGLRINGARAAQLGRPASTRHVDYQLAPFRSDSTLKALLAAGMDNRLFGSGGADFSAAPPSAAPVSFSTTNVQVEGVDEADLVKTDGRHLYALTPLIYPAQCCTTMPQRKVRIASMGAEGSDLAPVGEFFVTMPSSGASSEAGLYLHASNLVTITTGTYYGGWYYSPASGSETVIEVLGLDNPATPEVRYRARLAGTMVSSRRIGDRLYLVTRFSPNVPGYLNYASTEAQRAANRDLLNATPLMAMLPTIAENGAAPVVPLGLASIYAPQAGANPPVADMVVLSVFDVREPRLVQTMAIVGRTESMFVSNSAIYLASSRYNTRPTINLPLPVQQSLLNTDIHKIAIDGDMRLVGSGSIEGWVSGNWWNGADKAAFRFGEMGPRLGVVSSTNTGWWGSNSNRVTLLEPSSVAPGLLKTVSWLPNARRPQPLGKPNEALYGTRFVGNKLYAVTFRLTDPLYTVDLSDALDPRIAGEVEVPGFSDYLHPLPNGMLLGFGRDASATGAQAGLQVSLYDVTGAAPRELQRLNFGSRGSDSPLFSSHHAVSVLPRADGTTVVAFPAKIVEGPLWQYSGLLRFEVRGTTPADARLVHTQTLKTDTYAASGYYPPTSAEASWGYGRSVLFPEASVYVGDRFWRQDAAGNVSGPF